MRNLKPAHESCNKNRGNSEANIFVNWEYIFLPPELLVLIKRWYIEAEQIRKNNPQCKFNAAAIHLELNALAEKLLYND